MKPRIFALQNNKGMSLSTRYNPQDVEAKWYHYWMDKQYFRSVPDDREPFTIVIPPPNVTGVLHMGHMLNNTIQDILIRKARLEGKNACWVPGTDHASIATEAKVVAMLREKGIRKSDLTREAFIDYAWEWKEKYGGIILDQLKKLGASCDWDRTRFTMEPSLSKAVIHVFNDLYRKGKIYRGLRMTNWDPTAKTVLSNEEVIYQDENARLYYVRYQVEGTDEWVVIATQRPETIMADTGLAVNPGDQRYTHLHGKRVIVPLVDRSVPVIADTYVDPEFGTGALKVTPAHDQNDYDLGQKYQLEVIDIFNEDGTLNDLARFCVGMDRFEARKAIVKELEARGHLVKVEDYRTRLGRSERTNSVVEPRLTLQWFLDMKDFARTALEAVRSGEVRFFPESMWNMFYNWLNEDNVRDWCISRQLWWGQRIPAWYFGDQIFVAESASEALTQARIATGNPDLKMADLRQDEDVVDTWFSSWLWPISVFDGFDRTDDLRYYYPTNVLVTGWDIMFFWVARMIMSGYEWSEELLGAEHMKTKGRQPFRDVYFTGMVRDNKRRKMSKSLGNFPDALTLIENYGADGVRFGMMASAAAGNDILFDAPFDPQTGHILNESKLCEQGRNFCNKLWNALRLIKGWEVVEQPVSPETDLINRLAAAWLENKLNELIGRLDKMLASFRLSEAIMELYKFIWDDFCSWYLEMIKPGFGDPIDDSTLQKTLTLLDKQMTLLHPFMPFITEEVWQNLRRRQPGEDCIVSQWPAAAPYDETIIRAVESAKVIVTGIREIRNNKGIKNADPLNVFAQPGAQIETLLDRKGIREMISKMANLEALTISDSEPENSVSFLAGTNKFHVVLRQAIDTAEECKRLRKELEYLQGFVASVQKKLSNEGFVSKAPPQVIEAERKKMADGESKINSITATMGEMGCGD